MFTKEESNFCKGIAIIAMIFHHLFYKAENYSGIAISFFPLTEERINFYALFGKICVAIFVFISGYGIAFSYRKQFVYKEPNAREIFLFIWRRIWKLMAAYWFAFVLTLIFQPLGRTIIEAYGTDLKSMVLYFMLDFLGVAYLFGTPTLNPTWWYMTIAILIIVLMPMVIKLMNKMGVLTLLASCIGVIFLFNASNANTFYLFSMLLGAGCFENNLFERIENIWRTKRWGKWVKGFITIIVLGLLLSLRTNYNYFGIIDGLIAMALAVLTSVILIHIPVISTLMQCLGKYSGNMFLVHNQIYSYYFRNFIYSFGNWSIITFMLTLISFVVAVVMEVLKKVFRYDKIMNRIEKKIFFAYTMQSTTNSLPDQ